MTKAHLDLLKSEAELKTNLLAAERLAREERDEESAAAILALLTMRALLRSAETVRRRAVITLTQNLGDLERVTLLGDHVVDPRAERYSQRARAKWIRAAREARAEGLSPRQARNAASKRVRPYLSLVGETEAARAYNIERADIAARYARQTGELVLLEWDATLDRRTCGECEYMHGQRVSVLDGWRGQGPGEVHPRCRCVSLIIVESAGIAA